MKKFRIYGEDNSLLGYFDWNKLPQMLFPEKWIVQQFTSKLDNKGQEIYEGDIIYYRHKFEHGGLHEGRAEVIWDEEIAAFSFDGFTWLDTNIVWDSIKVVGNRFSDAN